MGGLGVGLSMLLAIASASGHCFNKPLQWLAQVDIVSTSPQLLEGEDDEPLRVSDGVRVDGLMIVCFR